MLERTLRAVIACDALTDAQRAQMLAVMYGAPGRTMDGTLLNDIEQMLIQHYR